MSQFTGWNPNSILWNLYSTEGPRMTNHLEGWHNKLKKLVKSPHPNILNMIKLLQHEEAIHLYTLLQYWAGGKLVPRKRKYREIDSRPVLKTRLENLILNFCVILYLVYDDDLLHFNNFLIYIHLYISAFQCNNDHDYLLFYKKQIFCCYTILFVFN